MDLTSIAWLAAVIILLLYLISVYNQLVTLKNRYKNAFAQIEVQLKRRYDLIPNLVDVAKHYVKHERETLETVTDARNLALAGLKAASVNPSNPDAISELNNAENTLIGALGRLGVVVEAYPDLKANQNMMQLTEELSSTENKVSFARQAFNDAVMAYNIYRQSFPSVFLAALFGHRVNGSLLEFTDSATFQAAPQVEF